MKFNIIKSFISAAVLFVAASCVKEYKPIDIYNANTGEEYLNVNVDTLSFSGRGGDLTFIADASYDATIESSADWVTLSSSEFPGDRREFTVTVTAPTNRGEGASDRECLITVKSRTVSKTIVVLQPLYNRPVDPESICDAETFKYWFETCAVYYEEGDVMNVTSDINLGDVAITPVPEFKGTLNGNGFSITNYKSDAPLFLVNRGVINDLVIASSCSYSVPSGTIYFSPFVAENYGTISGCVNRASVTVAGERTEKVYFGGMAGYHYAGGVITGCKNYGALTFSPSSSKANAYIGGICGYSYGDVTKCDNYGPISGNPEAFSAVYYIGGITPRHETGALTFNVNHKEAKIYTNEKSSGSKSYIGGIAGYVKGAPVSTANEVYSDIEVNLKVEVYVGGLQAWQDRVSSGDATIFESSIVNCNITAYTKASGQYGDNPCKSAGLVTGRFSGQSGYSTLHYGNETNPIKVSGSIKCLASGASVVASSKDYKALLDGDGSKSSVNGGACPEADYNTILYEVRGDGQKGDAEDLIIKGDALKLTVPAEGGEASFSVRGNYAMTITPKVDWLSVDATTVEGNNAFNEVKVTATANTHTFAREGQIFVTMPMGSTEIVTVAQAGNMTLPESLEVSSSSLVADPAGTSASTFTVTANYETSITADAQWIKVSPDVVAGDETAHTVSVLCDKNSSGEARSGKVIVTMPGGKSFEITVSQEKFVYVPKTEIGSVADFLDLMTYGGDASVYPATFTVKLTSDIDLKGKSFAPVEEFVATLDGQGHSIRNWVSEAPLFTTLKGNVTNLKIDASCSTKASVNIAYIAVNNYGTIENCINNAALKVTDTPSASTRIASFADYCYGTIKGCTNNGAVTFEPATTAGIAVYLAGIVCTVSGGTLDGCTNNGKVSYAPSEVTAKAYQRVGGIASICLKNNNATITGCVNTKSAPVTIADPSGLITNAYAGNIVADIETKGVGVLDNCSAFGDVTTNVKNDNSKVGGLVGVIAKYSKTITLMSGCSVNCNVTGAYKTVKNPSYNLLNSCGMIVGRLGGDIASAPLTLGSAENPVKVSGTISITASDGVEAQSVTLSAENFGNYLGGDGSGLSTTSGSDGQIINAEYNVVSRQ